MGERDGRPDARSAARGRLAIIVAVVVVFAALAAVKLGRVAQTGGFPVRSAVRPSAERGDAVAAYGAALKTGRPVYVLFHSLACKPCIEISAVADDVVPGYEGKVTFVNAVTDDPGAQRLASRFRFQYIPTSFFLAADGTVVDSHTGVLSAVEMRRRLDRLAGASR